MYKTKLVFLTIFPFHFLFSFSLQHFHAQSFGETFARFDLVSDVTYTSVALDCFDVVLFGVARNHYGFFWVDLKHKNTSFQL